MQKENWKGKIPENYYVQVLHCLMVTEYDFAVLKAQLKSVFNNEVYIQIRHYFIDRNEVEEDIEYLCREEEKFWEILKKEILQVLSFLIYKINYQPYVYSWI